MTISPEQVLKVAKEKGLLFRDSGHDIVYGNDLHTLANAVLAEYLGEPVYIDAYSYRKLKTGNPQSARVSPHRYQESDTPLYAPRKE